MSERKLSVYVWWALNFFLVLFAFLAMVLSAASLHKSADISRTFTTNNNYAAWNMVLSSSYKVAPGQSVQKGQMVSFVGIDNNGSPQIAPGLGPQWGTPAFAGWQAPASSADISQLSSAASIYAWVSSNIPTVLQIGLLSTPASGGVNMVAYTNFTLPNSISFVKVKALNPTNFALMYSTGDGVTTFRVDNIAAGYVDTGLTTITVSPSSIVINNDPTYAIRELSVITNEANSNQAWAQVSHGIEGGPCVFDIYQFNTNSLGYLQKLTVTQNNYLLTCQWPVTAKYISGGYFVVSNGVNLVLAQANWASSTITGINTVTLPKVFGTLEITVVSSTQLVLSGVQMPGVEGPQPIVEVVQIANGNLLLPSPAINMFPSIVATLYRGHLRACYYNNYLLFTYVDSFFGIASLIRGEFVSNSYGTFVLPSTRIAVSTLNYTDNFFGTSSYGPLLVCPTASQSALFVYQAFPPAFNTFTWGGGFKLGGIAQSSGSAGQSVNVVKSGISYAHQNLETGFGYYVTNTGNLYPVQAMTQTFTPNGIPIRIGDALSSNNLVLAMNVLDLVNNLYL
eukprot:TRINITY_DN3402_c0_g3_i3.p1 TRINITY_DN3402_c0_g3~~TRINITY_DN3402_c0_g3_i3.p1  ORF type:complete len:566 (+),score=123.07 TRINITY_DN3402_c0_g3_i3:109-1806(+)